MNKVKPMQEAHLAKHIHFESIDSTNTWAKINYAKWALMGVTLISASGQTGGRGRFNRQWVSPPLLNIYATFCFWVKEEFKDIGHIPQLLAIAGSQMIEQLGFQTKIKWPNDILIHKKKIGGILCETVSVDSKRGVVCGIGLNVNMPLEILMQIDRPATSLLVEGGKTLDPEMLLEELQKEFISSLNKFFKQGFAPFFSIFCKRLYFQKGEKIRFHDNQNWIDGYFENLNPTGSINLRLLNGELKTFYAGEFG